jgi:hypothetical protein
MMKRARLYNNRFHHCLQNKAGSDGCDVTYSVETEKDSATREGSMASEILSTEIKVEGDSKEVSPDSVEVEESEDEECEEDEGSY